MIAFSLAQSVMLEHTVAQSHEGSFWTMALRHAVLGLPETKAMLKQRVVWNKKQSSQWTLLAL
jgi:hypothetical protein